MYYVKPDFIKSLGEYTLIDCRFDMENSDWGPSEYKKSHIEGAAYVALKPDMAAKAGEHGGRHPLQDLEVFKNKMESIGVSDEKPVIIYDDGGVEMAARLWYMLQLIGKDSYIVEGGYDALLSSGFKSTDKLPELAEGKLNATARMHLLADVKKVLSSMEDSKSIIVDSRSLNRYLGKVEPFDKIAGHLPSAICIFWKDLFDGSALKPKEDLQELYAPLKDYDEVIFHCGSGITGAVNLFVYREVGGENAILYSGSYSDYISYSGNKLIVEGEKEIVL